MSLSASVAASALTINVLAADTGSAPTSSHPVLVPFRSTTLATGTVTWTAITSAQSIVIPSGATLGTSNSTPFRIWIFEEYNGGSPEIAVSTCSTTTQIYPCASWETNRVTTTTISGLATAAGTPYSAAGVSNDAVRIIGYCDFASGLATVGAWASACTTLAPFGPGVSRPGQVVFHAENGFTTTATTTSATFATLTNGSTLAITPASTPDLIRVTIIGTVENSSASSASFLQLARGSTLIGNPSELLSATTPTAVPQILRTLDAPEAVTSQTYGYQGKIAGGATLSFPAASTGVDILLENIMGMLNREPVNDNIHPGLYGRIG